MAFDKPNPLSSQTKVRRFENGLVIWIPYAGIVNANDATKLEWWHPLCDVRELGSISMSAKNQRTIQHVGKAELTIDDGVRIDPFTLTMEADSIEQIASFNGQDFSTNKVVRFGEDGTYQRDKVGAIQIISTDSRTGTATLTSTLIIDVSVRFTQIPGIGTDNTWEVEFFAENAHASTTGPGYVHGCEIWYEGGSVVNAAAPDGTTVQTYVLGTGNDSASAATPDAEVFNPDYATATDPRRWFAAWGTVNSDGQLVQGASTWTFTDGTSTLDTISFLAANTKLCLFYVCTDDNMPHEAEMDESWRAVNTV